MATFIANDPTQPDQPALGHATTEAFQKVTVAMTVSG
jgi:hypothetical protein